MQRIDLLEQVPWLERILKSRLFQPVSILFTLFVFTVVILAGLFGTPAGSHNFAIIFVWIVWWALLILILVPFLGRAWCAICPIPAPGEWMQRRNIVSKHYSKLRSLNWRWPKRFRNMWLQNFGFLGVALFSIIILTRPNITAWLLLAFILAGILLSVFYKNRVFCRYVCPVGGFIGLYSMLSPLELRVRDPQVCLDHKTKDCVTGNANAYGCPWMVFPGKLERNNYCGMCAECLRACPKNNITFNLRSFGTDLLVAEERKLDEAYKAFIMLSCAFVYSLVLTGPLGWLKNWANIDTLSHWLTYAAAFLALNLLIVPAIFLAASWLSQRIYSKAIAVKRLFIDYAYTLVPMGLAAWMAFSLSFVLVNGSYALQVLSDPFGWGWDLFGTGNFHWTPIFTNLIPFLQVGMLIIGLLFSVNTAFKIAQQHVSQPQIAFRAMLPIVGFLLLVTFAFMGLYLW